jgi:hypothetical protein
METIIKFFWLITDKVFFALLICIFAPLLLSLLIGFINDFIIKINKLVLDKILTYSFNFTLNSILAIFYFGSINLIALALEDFVWYSILGGIPIFFILKYLTILFTEIKKDLSLVH